MNAEHPVAYLGESTPSCVLLLPTGVFCSVAEEGREEISYLDPKRVAQNLMRCYGTGRSYRRKWDVFGDGRIVARTAVALFGVLN